MEMKRSDVGGVINWSAVGVAMAMPSIGLHPLIWVVIGLFLIGSYLVITDKSK
jgi:hypothetical protein